MKIGLEVHVYLNTKSKMYCSCPVTEALPNTNICPVCTGQPGAKPMATNMKAVEEALIIGKALNCKMLDRVTTMRKHYFYPDLPNNYQRTSSPFAVGGEFMGIRIREVHWEEDAGRYDPKKKTIDLNRSGVPLVEIVTEPDMKSPKQAKEFLLELRHLLSYLRVGRGIFKVDTNISLGSERVEIKNINSIKGVETALAYEIKRQTKLLNQSKKVKRETRHFDETTGKTVSLREKETVEDYRFIADPDLPPVDIKEIRVYLPKPLEEVKKNLEGLGLKKEETNVLTTDWKLTELFFSLSKKLPPQFVANWIKTELMGELHYRSISFSDVEISANGIAQLLADMYHGKITRAIAKRKLRAMLDNKQEIEMRSISKKEVTRVIREVIESHPKEVKKYLKGKTQLLNFLVGETLKRLDYCVEPKEVIVLLKNELESYKLP
ncbi:MAG: Asp-tRNA(Asn)/Glu-tRNA(Gln) amidotransferase subunit GatB [Candidatus Diapherotrites archaeon]|nr:Asp-tRNA(Asn)/Glu-tRNA(Gln) amidotransferase subunit GatB [Candidatus Diapherotrites archaeon]